LGLIKRNWVWILTALLGIGVFTAFRLNQKPESEYFTAKVEKGNIRQVIEATGTINPVTLVQVGSQVSGMVSKLYVDFNSKVTQGQIIAEIDPKLFQGAVQQAQADLQNAQATLAAAKANLAKDEATLEPRPSRVVAELANDRCGIFTKTPVADSCNGENAGGHEKHVLQCLFPIVTGERRQAH